MAEMLIDGAKLDACNTAEADAIRAKTGGTDPIPYDYENNRGFADAIATIPSGGGGLAPVLVTSTGGSANDVLTQCRAAVGSQQVFVQNAQQTAAGSAERFLYYGIYVDITNGGNTRHLNTAYQKTASGNYAFIEFTSAGTGSGIIASGSQFYVWALDGVFDQP